MPYQYEAVPASLEKPKLRLFYDTISPFSHFACEVMARYRDDPKSPWKGKVDFELVPSDLIEIRKRADNFPGPPAIRSTFFSLGSLRRLRCRPVQPSYLSSTISLEKARYLAQDMHRNRTTYRVPLIPNPKAAPAKTGENLLLLAHIKVNYPDQTLWDASRGLFKAYWELDLDPAQDDVMSHHTGLPPLQIRDILSKLRDKSSKEYKEASMWLEKWTTEAADAHAFGAPWLHAFRTVNGKTEMQVFFGLVPCFFLQLGFETDPPRIDRIDSITSRNSSTCHGKATFSRPKPHRSRRTWTGLQSATRPRSRKSLQAVVFCNYENEIC